MNTQRIAVEFPADILLALNETENQLVQRIKLALAVQLYRAEKLTIGKAAQVAGLSRLQFETALAEHEIPVSDLTADEVLDDIGKLQQERPSYCRLWSHLFAGCA